MLFVSFRLESEEMERSMRIRTGILSLILLMIASSLSSETFLYKYFRDQKYKIKSEVNEDVWINGSVQPQRRDT